MNPKRRIIPVFVPHAGCKHVCVFCNQNKISESVSIASADDVLTAVGSHASDCCCAEIAFYGGSFTAIPQAAQDELLAAAQPFLSQNPSRSIRVSTRPDCIDESTAARLKRSGVRTVELGAQSMCDDVLAESGRGHTSADVAQAAQVIRSANLSLILQMMTGLPCDNREKSLYTARRFVELKPDGVRIYPAVVVRGTELYEMWLRGQYREHTVEEAVALCAETCPIFIEAGIPVIRLGLNPTDALSAGDAAAGAYHPAFGDLVYSRMYYNKAVELLQDIPVADVISITVPKGRKSFMIGHKRQNIQKLAEKFALRDIKVFESEDSSEIAVMS